MRGYFLFFLVAGLLAVLCLSAPAAADAGDASDVADASAGIDDASLTVTKDADEGDADDNEDGEQEDAEYAGDDGDEEEAEDDEEATGESAALETETEADADADADAEVEATAARTSCRSLYRSGKRTSGYYQLNNPAYKGKAYCNMRQGGWQLCAAIPASPAGSNFKFGRQRYGSLTSRVFSLNCERYMKKGAVLRVSRSRSAPTREGHNQCTLRDNRTGARTRACSERRNQFAWWVPRANGCYRQGNAYRFSVLRTGLPKTTVCMRNRHWIGSNSCQCFNSHGAWQGRKYTGMLYLWVMESKPRSTRRRKGSSRKPIHRRKGSAGARRRRRVAVRGAKKSKAALRKAQHRARIARIRARHSAFKSKVTSAVQRYATSETQRLIKWFIATYLDKDAVSMAKPLEKKVPVPRKRLDPEPGPSPSDPEPFEIKHRRKPDSPGTRDDVIPIPGLITEKNKDAKIDVYPPKP